MLAISTFMFAGRRHFFLTRIGIMNGLGAAASWTAVTQWNGVTALASAWRHSDHQDAKAAIAQTPSPQSKTWRSFRGRFIAVSSYRMTVIGWRFPGRRTPRRQRLERRPQRLPNL